MRVLHVAESVLGGCGTYLNEIVPLQVAELGAENIRVILPNQHLRHLSALRRDVIQSFRRTSRPTGVLHLSFAVCVVFARFRPEIVHVHSTVAGIVVRVIALLCPKRPVIIYCPHGWAFEIGASRRKQALIAALERFLSRYCDAVVAISEAERREAEGIGIAREKLVVLHNGIAAVTPETAAADWPANRRKVLFVGRLDRQKGVDILLAAARGQEDSLSVRIIGEAVVSKRGVRPIAPSSAEQLGWLSQVEVARQMNACDVVVMPSRWEGFGLVAIEAMRAGKPVIASAVGGLTEIVADGVTGRLVPAGNVLALRSALLAHTNEELARMGSQGRQLFNRHFTSARLHSALLGLYINCLAVKDKAPANHNVVPPMDVRRSGIGN